MAENRVRLTAYVFLGILCGSLILNAAASFNFAPLVLQYESPGFNRFRSEAELRWFLDEKAKANMYTGWDMVLGGIAPGIQFAIKGSAGTANSLTGQESTNDYSSTNIQVAGVDEADIVKTDGQYIYLTRLDTVYIIKAYPAEDAELVAKIRLEDQVGDLLIAGNKLVVFVNGYGMMVASVKGGIYRPYSAKTEVYFYDVSDRTNPVLERTYEAEGSYIATRMIGNFVYVVSQKGAWLYDGVLELPAYTENGRVCQITAPSIYYYNGTDNSYAYTTIASVNTQDSTFPIQSETFLLGSSSTVYCSAENLYLTTSGYSETGVHKIRLDNGSIEGVADGTVPGWVLNQFSMDESEGYFRIATTTGYSWGVAASSKNNVYVLDPEMKIVGRLEDLAPGEQIYSARFMGDRLYMVTFKKVDPLFVIDLSEPTAPRVLGKLKIPGYSNYLHPYDENHVIGLGKEAVDAEGGDFAWYQGVKLSLFDVTDVSNPIEVAKLEIGDRGTDSPALYDHKAFLFNNVRNLLVIPVLEAKVSGQYASEANAYGDFVYQGAYVFDISTDGIRLRGRISHLQGDELLKSGYWFDSDYSVLRSLYIGENLYTISGRMVKINSLSDLSELKTIALN